MMLRTYDLAVWIPLRLKGYSGRLRYRLTRSALFRGFFHVLLDVPELCLDLAEVLLNVAFSFQRLVVHHLAGRFLDGSFRLFDATLNLVFVHAHDMLL